MGLVADIKNVARSMRRQNIPFAVSRFSLVMLMAGLFAFSCQLDAKSAPPKMPQDFDQQTVRELVDNIDTGHNATILEFGYFLKRNLQPFPQDDGYALLKDSLVKERKGSKRWFVLQAVRGFAGMHLNPDTKEDAYRAYDALFSQFREDYSPEARDVVGRAIYDFTVALPGNYGLDQTSDDIIARDTLLRALEACLVALKRSGTSQYRFDWTVPVNAVNGGLEFVTPIQRAMSDPDFPKTFSFLYTVAGIYRATKPEVAVTLLRDIRSKVPTDEVSIKLYYQMLVSSLAEINKIDDAILEQQKLIKLSNYGRSGLAELYKKKNDGRAYEAVLASLAGPTVSDTDVIESSEMLIKTFKKSPSNNSIAKDHAVSILSAYLSASRKRDVEQERVARILLMSIRN